MHENASVNADHRGNHKPSSSTLRFSVILSPIRCAWLTREMLRLGISFLLCRGTMICYILLSVIDYFIILFSPTIVRPTVLLYYHSFLYLLISFISIGISFCERRGEKGEEIGKRTRKLRNKNERKKRQLMILIRIILSPREDCFI